MLGPLFVTLIVNFTLSVTFATVTLTSFTIAKSTTGNAVMFSIVSMLFDMFVSFSVLVTTTTFEIVPFEMTLALMTSATSYPLVKFPMYQIPVFTSYSPIHVWLYVI